MSAAGASDEPRGGRRWSFLQIVWFILVAVLLAGYAGARRVRPRRRRALPLRREDRRRRRRSCGTAWGPCGTATRSGCSPAAGALFAAFPPVYATVFSGFYLALMLVLFALIFRAVSFEFRAQDPAWGGLWDWAFFGGSAAPGPAVRRRGRQHRPRRPADRRRRVRRRLLRAAQPLRAALRHRRTRVLRRSTARPGSR